MGIKVGVVGLGDMGGGMAQKLIADGFATRLWARRREVLDPYLALEGSVAAAGSLVELGEGCDLVCVCVFADADVREVVLGGDSGAGEGLLHGMRRGRVIAIHSTASPALCVELAAAGRERGVRVLDAPVSGARAARASALAGELVVMVGGDLGAFELAAPVFRSFGELVRRVGDIGSGQKAKILNNALAGCNLYVGHLALQTGARLGLEPGALADILLHGSARSEILGILVERIFKDPDFARICAAIAAKDGELFQQLCRDADIAPSRLNELTREVHLVFEGLLGD